MIKPVRTDKTLEMNDKFDILHEMNEVEPSFKRRASWNFVFNQNGEFIVDCLLMISK